MPGVEVFTDKPVHSRNSSTAGPTVPHNAPTHTTPAAANDPSNVPASAPAATTATPTSTSTHTAAQPGAAPPAPTSTSSSRYAPPLAPTPTQKYVPTTVSSSPPPPQPGAVPTPFSSTQQSPLPKQDIPPPPKVGESILDPSHYAPTPTTKPTQSVGPQKGQQLSTQTTTQSSEFAPESSRHGHARSGSTQHPPGYMQDPYATELRPEQRQSSQYERSEGLTAEGFNPTAVIGSFYETLRSRSMDIGRDSGILGGGGGAGAADDGDFLSKASGWVKDAGKKIAEVEEEVWRKVNGKS